VAKNVGMIEALNKGLNLQVNVHRDSHFMGALGAALFAMDHIRASRIPTAVHAA
jgi:activator of 2-hydroxyglutaryl-CoA dehydratase